MCLTWYALVECVGHLVGVFGEERSLTTVRSYQCWECYAREANLHISSRPEG